MVLNKHGGKKAKSSASKNQKSSQKNTRIAVEKGEIYGIIIKKLGGGHLTVKCVNGKDYMCHIGGKFKRETINVYDFILVGEREWQSSKEMVDLLEVYNENDKKRLFKITNINWSILTACDGFKSAEVEEDLGFDFSNDEQINMEELIQQLNQTRNQGIIGLPRVEEGSGENGNGNGNGKEETQQETYDSWIDDI